MSNIIEIAGGHSDDLNYFLGAIGSMFQEIEDLAADGPNGEVGWSCIVDVDRCPEKGLDWLAQLVGVTLDHDQPLRQQVRSHDRWSRGTQLSMIGEASRWVPEGSRMYMSERNPDPYHILFILVSDPAIVASSNYSAEIITDTPVTRYRMNASAGTVETDLGSLAQNGTYVNSPTLGVEGLVEGTDTAVKFNANLAQYLLGVDNDAYSIRTTNSLSVEFWYEFDAVPANVERLVSKTFPTSNNAEWHVRLGADGIVTARVFTLSGTLLAAASFGNPTVGERHHYVFTVETDIPSGVASVKAYLDGQLTDTQTYNYTLTGNGIGKLQINGSYQETFYSTGIFDEVAIYSQALSPGRISSHYAAGVAEVSTNAQIYEDLFEVYDSYYHLLTDYPTYSAVWGDLRGDWSKVEKLVLANKPAGIQVTFLLATTALYFSVWSVYAHYSDIYALNHYSDLYDAPFPDINITPPRGQQLVSARYYRNLYHQFETYQHIIDAYQMY